MSEISATQQALTEKAFCEAILAKAGRSVLTETLVGVTEISAWAHYPEGDVFDPASGAQWYYHCHPRDTADALGGEHGHFHCFLRPEGQSGKVHHLIAIGVTDAGEITRLFTVNQWVVGDDWLEGAALCALLPRFDVQMPLPNYLVNRWLTAVVTAYEPQIESLIAERDLCLENHKTEAGQSVFADRSLEVTSQLWLNVG